MKRRIFSIILALIVIIIFTASLVTPVMAGTVQLGKNTYLAVGEKAHPDDTYLVGMTAHYNLSVTNPSTTERVTDMIVRDIEPGGSPSVVKATGVSLEINGQAGDTWTGTHSYTIVEGDLVYVASPPANRPHNKIVNTLAAAGNQGESDDFDLSLTKTSWIISPAIKVTKTVDTDTASVGDTVHYTIKIENTGDWPLSKDTLLSGYGVDDSVMGDISGYFTTDPLPVGGFEERTIPYEIPDADPNPLENIVTATYFAEEFDPTISGATVSDDDNAIVNLIEPSTKVTIEVSLKTLPAEGGKVDITVTEKNDGTGVSLEDVFVHVVANSAFFANLDFDTPPTTFKGGDSDNLLEPNETWEWVIHDVEITEETLFEATGNGYYGEAPNRVNVTFPPDSGEYDYDTVKLNPPVEAPGISNTGLYLLIAGFAGIITLFAYRRARVTKQ